MDKKYTVFVSSTYEDLREERQEVMQALLEIDCIPCGMELFPASDDEQFEFIKRVIDDCDYYVLILAGRYGSMNQQGISYTEMEFRYAMERNIPIISFIHGDVSLIPSGKCEQNKLSKKKLEEFRLLAKRKLCKYWTSKEQLSGLISRSVIQQIKSHPAVGWVRANHVSNEETLIKMTQLYEENRLLKNTVVPSKKEFCDLARGEEETNILFKIFNRGETTYEIEKFEIKISWNDILKIIGPTLIEEHIRFGIEKCLKEMGIKYYFEKLMSDDKIKYFKENQFLDVADQSLGEILVQFMALGYIEVYHPNHNNDYDISHESRYVLTELGRNVLFQLAARKIRK